MKLLANLDPRLLYAYYIANPTARSSFANLLAAMSLPTQYFLPNYGERKDQVFKRLEEEIHKLYKGIDFEQFAVGLSLASFREATQFVAREKELSKIHELLHGHSNRTCVVLYGLGGIGKTQLTIETFINSGKLKDIIVRCSDYRHRQRTINTMVPMLRINVSCFL
ncbi:hypothetical protein G7Y89_g43 [Cudoniella acicularis]|uniref:Uncharacterized protein n=1 Tax=Cudoniella acicularis TaxID=354080 RepID=A0A8H4RYX9_9HELO|nr:hypothetical protein G7Y89_g43 [Cudoniella acicularis]